MKCYHNRKDINIYEKDWQKAQPSLPFHLRYSCVMKKHPLYPVPLWYNAFGLLMPTILTTSYIVVCYCFAFNAHGEAYSVCTRAPFEMYEVYSITIVATSYPPHLLPVASTRQTEKTFFKHKLNKLFKRLALTFNFEWFWVMSSTWQVVWYFRARACDPWECAFFPWTPLPMLTEDKWKWDFFSAIFLLLFSFDC